MSCVCRIIIELNNQSLPAFCMKYNVGIEHIWYTLYTILVKVRYTIHIVYICMVFVWYDCILCIWHIVFGIYSNCLCILCIYSVSHSLCVVCIAHLVDRIITQLPRGQKEEVGPVLIPPLVPAQDSTLPENNLPRCHP